MATETTAITAVKQEVRLQEWLAQIEAQQASGLTAHFLTIPFPSFISIVFVFLIFNKRNNIIPDQIPVVIDVIASIRLTDIMKHV